MRALAGALREVGPTLLPSVPSVFEAIAARIRAELEEAGGVAGPAARWAVAAGGDAAARRRSGRRLSPSQRTRRLVAAPVLARVRRWLGGRLRLGISGGAALPADVGESFDALGLPVLEGYGQTECTAACTMNPPARHRPGTIGQALPGVELRIAEDGEVLIRGPNVFQGYYGDTRGTRAAVDGDGWLASGDVGAIDADGFLRITDRKKDLIVTAGGKKVSPQNIERALKRSKYVAEAVVFGEGRRFIVALIVPEWSVVGDSSPAGTQVRTLLGRVVDEVNAGLGDAERVRRFAILPQPLSAAEGEITPTLKVRRHICEQHFHELIEGLYAPGGRSGAHPETP